MKTLNKVTRAEWLRIRNESVDVRVANPEKRWQDIGCIEYRKGGLVQIRWHGGNKDIRSDHRPVSLHPESEIIILE